MILKMIQQYHLLLHLEICIFKKYFRLHSKPKTGKKDLMKYYKLFYEETSLIMFHCFELFYPTLSSQFGLFRIMQSISSYQQNMLISYLINLSNPPLITKLIISIFSPLVSNMELLEINNISANEFKNILIFIINQSISIIIYIY